MDLSPFLVRFWSLSPFLVPVSGPPVSGPFLVPDNDAIYGRVFQQRVAGLGIEEVRTAYRSPWQNAYVERLIGSVRRECLNHVIVLGERHLKRILTEYFEYHNAHRAHQGLEGDAPLGRNKEPPERGEVVAIPNGWWLASSLYAPQGCVSNSLFILVEQRLARSVCADSENRLFLRTFDGMFASRTRHRIENSRPKILTIHAPMTLDLIFGTDRY